MTDCKDIKLALEHEEIPTKGTVHTDIIVSSYYDF